MPEIPKPISYGPFEVEPFESYRAHPHESGFAMSEPYQIIEGHRRLAYLQALIRREHPAVKSSHGIFLVELPDNQSSERDAPKAVRP